MLVGITVLLVFQFVGEVAAYFTGGFVPGPVIGMAMAAIALIATRRSTFLRSPHEKTIDTSKAILANLGVLFVPAGVGIILHLERLQREWPAILGSVLFATLISVALTGLLLRALSKNREAGHE